MATTQRTRQAEITGPQLRIWREVRQMTQQELADFLGVNRRTVNAWENARMEIQHERMLAHALDHHDCQRIKALHDALQATSVQRIATS